MKKRTAVIGALVSLLPIGQPLVIGTGAALTSAAVMLSIPRKAQADSAKFYFNRAYTKAEEGDYYGAISDLNKSIEINPSYANAYYNRGHAKHNIEDYYGAISDNNRAIQINPNNHAAYRNRGMSKYAIGDKSGACSDWMKAISIGNLPTKKWLATDGGSWCRNM